MRFQTLLALGVFSTAALAQDAGVSSIVSEVDSLKSDIYGLSTATNLDHASSVGAELGSFIASITTNSDWPAASSILNSQAATDSAALSSLQSSLSSAGNSAAASATSAASAAASSASSAQASATSAALAPAVTAGLTGMMAMGVLGAAVLL